MPDTKTIQLDALDTLFFKDGKPFSMGEETWADGIFPPPPSVIYGALRTALMATNYASISLEGSIKNTENLIISYLAFQINGKEAYPIPMDVVEKKDKPTHQLEVEKDDKEYEVFSLPISQLPNDSITSSKQQFFPQYRKNDDEAVEVIDKGCLFRDGLESYLKNSTGTYKAGKIGDYLLAEAKVGIKRNRETRSTSDEFGELYRVGMNRLSNLSFLVGWSLSNDEKKGERNINAPTLVRLGAEGKVAESSPFLRRTWKGPMGISTNNVKVYLATPCPFEGNLPKVDQLNLLKVKGLKLVGYSCGKPFNLGGYDMQKRQPKPMLKVFPAGTVFYLKTDSPILLDELQGKSIASVINGIDYAKQGFGLAYFGTW